MKPRAVDCARLAMEIADGLMVPYVLGGEDLKGLDCQGFVEYVVRKLGGSMSFRGTNHMYREACSLAVKIGNRKPVPGCVLFIVHEDEEAPGYYDNKGNASHIGWYCGGKHEVVHSSSSRGKVAPSTLKNGWTHIGWLKSVDYSEGGDNMPDIIVQYNEKGPKVTEMQKALVAHGYPLEKYGADGHFGLETLSALQEFQKDSGLPVLDYCDPRTWAALSSPKNDNEYLAEIERHVNGILEAVATLRAKEI